MIAADVDVDELVERAPEMLVPLAEIELDPRLQHRDQLHEDAADEYGRIADRIEPGAAVYDGDKYHLFRGMHRYAGCVRHGRAAMRLKVIAGEWDDAFAAALGENVGRRHGLRRTNADVRRAVEAAEAASAKYGWGWSDREICRRCKVDESYLSTLRRRRAEVLTVSSAAPGAGEPTPVRQRRRRGTEDAPPADPRESQGPAPRFAAAVARREALDALDRLCRALASLDLADRHAAELHRLREDLEKASG